MSKLAATLLSILVIVGISCGIAGVCSPMFSKKQEIFLGVFAFTIVGVGILALIVGIWSSVKP